MGPDPKAVRRRRPLEGGVSGSYSWRTKKSSDIKGGLGRRSNDLKGTNSRDISTRERCSHNRPTARERRSSWGGDLE